MRKLLRLLVTLFAALSGSVHAQTIFFQDFESGLGANESAGGNFSINNTNAPLNNGTQMMGHASSYGNNLGGFTPPPWYSWYDVTVDLTGRSNTQLTFDFVGGIEVDFDGFNLLANASGTFAPPADLIFPTAGSDLQYSTLATPLPELGETAWFSLTYPWDVSSHSAIYDLSAFDGGSVTVRFQFGSDLVAGGAGANFDNVLFSEIPEPSVSLLALAAFGLVSLRRKR